MSQELEIEFKNLLTEGEYQQLLQHFQVRSNQFFDQENSYFDTKDFQLKNHDSALRIRIKHQQAEMTLKTPESRHLLETNEELSIEQAGKLIASQSFIPSGEIAKAINTIGIDPESPVYLTTYLKTKRAEVELKSGLVVLDQSWYGDTMDFELEIETQNEEKGKTLFLTILEEFKIPKRYTPNKIQRALTNLSKNI